MLTSCTSLAAPSESQPTKIEAIEQEKDLTPTILPTASPTLFLIDPFHVPTPVNTPHPTPSIHSESQTSSTIEAYKNLFDERVKYFENTLLFDIQIIEVGFELLNNSRYIVVAEGKVTNISDNPIVVRKVISTGLFYPINVSWKFLYNEEELNFPLRYNESFYSFTQDDFVILQPNEFQIYKLVFALPSKATNNFQKDINLSGKKIALIATYDCYMVEYFSGDFYDHKYIDVNSWVGEVQSNSVEYVFP
jgi:hypothetical protein